MIEMHTSNALEPTEPEVFWGEIAPGDHLVQFYQQDEVFLEALQRFVGTGLALGEGVIVVATPQHIDALDDRLQAGGHGLSLARSSGQYIARDAEELLSRILVAGWPDEERFEQVITDLITHAQSRNRRVRAFGEMVAILWARGNNGATVRLEHLWQRICQREAFSLFCAYPRIGVTQGAEESMHEICAAHSKVIAG